jgi:hypothetical protein
MATEPNVKEQIYQLIESLPAERLPDLLYFLDKLLQHAQSEAVTAPIYQIHQHAVDTGVSDLAAQHDHYLYGTSDPDA